MIICPVKIESGDRLPQQICDECLEVVLSAFTLREISSQNEKYLLECIESEPHVKQEIFEETSIFCEALNPPATRIEFTVDCFKSDNTQSKSPAWQYFGNLCYETGELIDGSFLYCKLCVASGLLMKYKKTVATSCLLRHISLKHDIETGDIDSCTTFIPPSKTTKTFECDYCLESFTSKARMEAHMLKAHDSSSPRGKLRFRVSCCKNEKSRKTSKVWKYFGRLVDSLGDDVLAGAGYNYCRLCVEEKHSLKSRFLDNNVTTDMIRHLKKRHQISLEPCEVQEQSAGMASRAIAFNQRGFAVNCHKSPVNRSPAWNYFGTLIDSNGKSVEAEKGNLFCKLCVQEGIDKKFSPKSATTNLMLHLKSVHGIGVNTQVIVKATPKESCKESSSSSLNKLQLAQPTVEASEMEVESTADGSAGNQQGYTVNCFKASATRSPAWNYFGKLIDATGKLVEAEKENLFCKFCVQEGRIDKKFSPNCATTNLLFHLKSVHGIESHSSISVKVPPKKSSASKTCTMGCNEEFETRKAFFNHMRLVHKTIDTTDFICHVCSKTFSQNYILMKHMKIHDDIVYNCSFCPASFAYPDGLKRHEKIHDPNHLTKYQCDRCSNSYAEMKSLKNHILAIHMQKSRERKFECVHCSYKSQTAGNLRKHIMKHTGEVKSKFFHRSLKARFYFALNLSKIELN